MGGVTETVLGIREDIMTNIDITELLKSYVDLLESGEENKSEYRRIWKKSNNGYCEK